VIRAWTGLWTHSYRLGGRWLRRAVTTRRVEDPRGGAYRLLVPVEPWRYYELTRVAEHATPGRWLDVGSPKLLASWSRASGRGEWVAVDLLEEEIERWRRIDPDLDLRVADARSLPFPDASFDGCACISVVEHVVGDGDTEAMAEIWRVLRPGGVLHLTTNVAERAHDVLTADQRYGEVSEQRDELAFFERRYSDVSVRRRLLGLPWEELQRDYARERLPVHAAFFAARPWSFAAGGLLALVCPWNFRRSRTRPPLDPGEHAVVYLRLRKPADSAG